MAPTKTAARASQLELMTPIQQPATKSNLAFIRHKNFLWPAAVYDSYGQAMQERYSDLSSKTKQMLFFKIIETRNKGKAAEVLGYDDLWVTDVEDTFDIFYYLPEAMEQTALESTKWTNAMNQLQEIMQRPDDYERNPLGRDLFPQGSTVSKARITPSNSGKSKFSKSRKRQDDGRIWGCERVTKRGKSNLQEISIPQMNKTRPVKGSGKVTTPILPTSGNKTSGKVVGHGKLSPDSNLSSDNFYIFKQLWIRLKENGWYYMKASNNLHNWYYVRPHINKGEFHKAKIGQDYFTTEADLIEWARSESLHEKLMTDESSMCTPVSNLTSTDDEGSSIMPSSDIENSISSKLSFRDQQRQRLKFPAVWPILSKKGWYHDDGKKYLSNPTSDVYFVRPTKDVGSGIHKKDYFMSTEEVLDYLCETDQAGDFLKKDDIPDVEASKPKSKKYTVENSKKKSAIKDKKKVSNLKLGSKIVASKNTERARASSGNRAFTDSKARKDDVTKKPTKKQMKWFHDESIPSFIKGGIYSLLSKKLNFYYSGGKYHLPKDVSKVSDVESSFDNDHDLSKFLCRYGIPNYEIANLTPEEQKILIRWATFANVPVTPENSTWKLRDITVLTGEEAISLLEKIHFVQNGRGGFNHVTTKKMFESINEVRRYVRGMPQLIISQKRSRNKSSPLNDDEILRLRVWAAMSPSPLPRYGTEQEA